MDETPSLTPLTKPGGAAATLTGRQIAGRLLVAVLIWLTANLLVFVIASFLIFVFLSSLGLAQEQEAFTLAILCAIPPALTISGWLAGRKVYYTISKRQHESPIPPDSPIKKNAPE